MKQKKFKRAKPRKKNNNSLPRLVFWIGILVWVAYIIYMGVKHADFK